MEEISEIDDEDESNFGSSVRSDSESVSSNTTTNNNSHIAGKWWFGRSTKFALIFLFYLYFFISLHYFMLYFLYYIYFFNSSIFLILRKKFFLHENNFKDMCHIVQNGVVNIQVRNVQVPRISNILHQLSE